MITGCLSSTTPRRSPSCTLPTTSLPMDSPSDGFQTLCAYARNYND